VIFCCNFIQFKYSVILVSQKKRKENISSLRKYKHQIKISHASTCSIEIEMHNNKENINIHEQTKAKNAIN
jgi:hypothetical protein